MNTAMKKSILFLAGIVGLSLASCDDTSDFGKPQVNQPPVVIAANGVTATASSVLSAPAINLNDYQNINIPILNITMASDFPENATVAGTFKVADNEQFENAVEIPVIVETVEEAAPEVTKEGEAAVRKLTGYIEGNLWEDAFTASYGYNPAPEDNYYTYVLYIQEGTQVTELTGDYVDARKILVTPVDQKFTIADNYYVFGKYIGNDNINDAVEMTHSDKHKYDDPIYKYSVKVTPETVGDFTWKIAGKDEPDANVYGVVDPAASNGQLRLLSQGGVPGQIAQDGSWTIEVDMLKKTYSIRLAADQLYVVGDATNGGFGDNALRLVTDDFISYYGFGLIKKSFKLFTEKSLKTGVNYGAGEIDGTLAIGGDYIKVASAKSLGLYYMTANVVQLKYEITAVKSIGVVGDLNNWGNDGDPDIALKANSNKTVWTGDVTVPAAGQYKFRCDNAWAINLGGALDNLTFGGDNLNFTEAGTYTVTLDLSKVPYSATVVKK